MLLTKSTDIRVLSISLKVTSNLFRQQHWLKQQLKIIYSLAEVPIIRQLAKRDYDKMCATVLYKRFCIKS